MASIAIVAIALSSCTGQGSQPSTTPGGAAPDMASDPRSKAVVTAYEGYWRALLAASNPADPADPKLLKVAVEPELDRARQLLTARKTAGETVRGRYSHQEQVVTITDTDATLTDCLSIKISVVDAKSKKVKRPETTGPFPVTAQLKLDGKAWKVADISAGNQNCMSTAPPLTPSTLPSTK